MRRPARSLILALTSICQFAHAEDLLVNGAGATFPYPLYSKWFSEYEKQSDGVRFNYQSIGSGGGTRQFMDRIVDFGATDAPMSDELLAKAKQGVVHIPTVLGAVVVTYNLADLPATLRLTPQLIGDIYMGRIKKWNDARIAAENPGLSFPDRAILPVYRSDGSGTTSIFTDYLAKTHPDWKSSVGQGPAVRWPMGVGAKGNEGVTGLVKARPGAVGYVELVYAVKNKLKHAAIKNRKGKYVEASPQSVSAAAGAEAKRIPEDFRTSLTDADGNDSYPLSSFTYLLLWKNTGAKKGPALKKFLTWALGPGQEFASALSYAPLPKDIAARARKAAASLETHD